jgi:hypothetical protein
MPIRDTRSGSAFSTTVAYAHADFSVAE